MAYLEILEGIDVGKTFPIIDDIILGRGAESDICLADARASRHHAKISQNEAHFFLEDLQSSNGTLLRNNKIFPGTVYDLAHGDHIHIGSTVFAFIDADAKAPSDDASVSDTDVFDNDYFEVLPPSPPDSLGQKEATPPSDEIWPGIQNRESLSLRIRYDESTQPAVAVSLDASINMMEMQEGETQTEDLRDVLKRLQTMCQVSTALGTIRDQSKLMRKILDCLLDIFPAADRSFILLRGAHSQKLIPVGVKQRHGEQDPSEELAISQSIIQEVKDPFSLWMLWMMIVLARRHRLSIFPSEV